MNETLLKGVGSSTRRFVSTAMVAAVGNGAAAFQHGREFAAWLGRVPRQHSTGEKAILGLAKCDNGSFGNWVRQLQARTARNKVVVHCE